MARQNHEITTLQPLLNAQGNLAEPGWSRSMVQQYRRKDIKASPFRIKEWVKTSQRESLLYKEIVGRSIWVIEEAKQELTTDEEEQYFEETCEQGL